MRALREFPGEDAKRNLDLCDNLGGEYIVESLCSSASVVLPNDGYCQFNADPKIRKVREKFADEVRAPGSTTD